MYTRLGIHWASTIPAFLALACVPFPFLFYKYGPSIREKCKYAAEAAAFMRELKEGKDDSSSTDEAEKERDAVDYSYEAAEDQPRFEEIKTGANEENDDKRLKLQKTRSYTGNPYDIDHVATREYFGPPSRSSTINSRKSRK